MGVGAARGLVLLSVRARECPPGLELLDLAHLRKQSPALIRAADHPSRYEAHGPKRRSTAQAPWQPGPKGPIAPVLRTRQSRDPVIGEVATSPVVVLGSLDAGPRHSAQTEGFAARQQQRTASSATHAAMFHMHQYASICLLRAVRFVVFGVQAQARFSPPA